MSQNKNQPAKPRSLKNLHAFILFAILGFILYGNTLKHEYALDDAIAITQNVFTQQGIKGVDDMFKYDSFVGFWMNSYKGKTAEQIQEEKKLVAGGRYRPLSFAMFAIEKEIFGEGPAKYHFFNVLYYILTAFVLYLFLKNLFPKPKKHPWLNIPLVATLLFMAHPVHTEVVANIKGRDEIMSFLGALLAGFAYLKYLGNPKTKYLVLAFVAMFAGLLSKENAITWLAVIPVAGLFFKEKSLKKHIKPFLSLFAASVVFLLIRQSVLGWGSSGTDQIAQELMNNPFLLAEGSERMGTIMFTLLVYLRLLFFPHPLTYDYYPFHIEYMSLGEGLPLLSLIIHLALVVVMFWALFAFLKKQAKPWLKMAGLISIMYLAPLSVVSNIFFPVGSFMNERFIYFSSLAFVLLIALIVDYVANRDREDRPVLKNVAAIVLVAIMGLYSVKTIARNQAWKNDYTLFTTDVKTSVNSAKSNTSAGGKLIERAKTVKDKQKANEMLDQAIAYLNRALEIHPDYVDAMLLLGNAHFQRNNDVVAAVNWYAEILKRRPVHTHAIGNTKLVLPQVIGLMANDNTPNTPDEVIAVCKKLEQIKPKMAEVYRVHGQMLARFKNEFDAAIPLYQKALEIKPGYVDAWKDLGVIYGQSQNYEEALRCFEKVHELKPNDMQAVLNIGITLQNAGDVQKSIGYFKQVLEKQPENLQALYFLGNAYKTLGDVQNANRYFAQYNKVRNQASGNQ
jgi:tetratricopeptide (TPR) repeat protein